jgi:heme-degrading monooxygenase HmoA|tara:strand:+ start:1337 stop:2059 length:723 start_codon:yes stop_codon:yes gene_type:complete
MIITRTLLIFIVIKPIMKNFSTLTLFTFETNKFWAFKQMGLAPLKFHEIEGLHFSKLMGTGSGAGFSLFPDFSTYAFLGVWESEEKAKQFFETSAFFLEYKKRSDKIRTLSLRPIHSHGKWSGASPFGSNLTMQETPKGEVAIITRATLRWNRLLSFWAAVPKASKAIEEAKGVRFYKGIGEWPFIQQATISIWESIDAVNTFAYKGKAHAEIVKDTRKMKWYKEDLFSRFELLDDVSHE